MDNIFNALNQFAPLFIYATLLKDNLYALKVALKINFDVHVFCFYKHLTI